MLRSIPVFTMRNLNKNISKIRSTDQTRVLPIHTQKNKTLNLNKRSALNRNIAMYQITKLREEMKEILDFSKELEIPIQGNFLDYIEELRGKLSYWEGLVGGKL